MIPLLVAALGGVVVVGAVSVRRRQPSLVDRLTSAGQKPKTQPKQEDEADNPAPAQDGLTPAQAETGPIRATLERLDNNYQDLIQTHLDPWFAGQLRHEQMKALTQGKLRVLSPSEKRNNRSLALGTGGLAMIGMANLTGLPLIPFVIALGVYNSLPAIQQSVMIAVKEHRFSITHLMLPYFFQIWLGGFYVIGTVGLIFGGLCQKFELLTQTVTRHSLTHLLGEQPAKVWIVKDGVEVEIPFEQLQIDDILVLTAGQPVPVDGVVVHGTAMVDQHRLTGESQPIEKVKDDSVLAATLVLGGNIHVRVEKTGAETAAAHIGEVLNNTVEHQEITLAEQFKEVEKYRWPMLAGGALGWLLRGPTAGVAMLGCNFMLTQIPLRLLTLLNGLGVGAERGILIKDGRALDRLSSIDTVIFDKTGTLTLELQQLASIHCCGNYSETDVLRFAAAVEQRQSHPIAQAILVAATERGLSLPTADDAHYELGFGLKAQIQGQQVSVGSERFLTAQNYEIPAALQEAQKIAFAEGRALVFVAVGEAVAGAIELEAVLRAEAKEIVNWLRHKGMMLYILSGDQDAPTARLAADLGMDGYFANTLPEQKAEQVKRLQSAGKKVCFIGDGINDAIALRQAEVSLSLRGATTVATDAAQVVLMDDDLTQLRLLWELAEGFQRSISSNARRSMQLSLLAAAGVLLLPYEFWTVSIMGVVQVFVGIAISQRSLEPSEIAKESINEDTQHDSGSRSQAGMAAKQL
ncbi:MAG: heavy metal translocating P-type ATPase [Cyanobacteriota bacterium]|jgi:heavy metal translocating P-type ATPase